MTKQHEPTDDELETEEEENETEIIFEQEDYLANVETKDTVGLYLKEAGRVPLLTPQEEIEITKRMELGLNARERLTTEKVPDKERVRITKPDRGWMGCQGTLDSSQCSFSNQCCKKIYGAWCTFLGLDPRREYWLDAGCQKIRP